MSQITVQAGQPLEVLFHRLGKQALSKIREMSTDSALEYAQFMLANMARTKDAREGFAAFNEKRAPNWTAE